MVQLVSPLISGENGGQLCFSFWYAAFGAGESALMQIIRHDNSSGEVATEKVRNEMITFCFVYEIYYELRN